MEDKRLVLKNFSESAKGWWYCGKEDNIWNVVGSSRQQFFRRF